MARLTWQPQAEGRKRITKSNNAALNGIISLENERSVIDEDALNSLIFYFYYCTELHYRGK